MGMKSRDNKNIKSSTCLAGYGAIVNDDFVPNEISAIESEFLNVTKTDCKVLNTFHSYSVISVLFLQGRASFMTPLSVIAVKERLKIRYIFQTSCFAVRKIFSNVIFSTEMTFKIHR